MELNALSFEPRKRNAWQVFDLTLLAVHRWGSKMFVLWFLQASIIFIPMALVFDNVIALLIVWWLKPVIERPLLHYASQAAFGFKPSTRECLAAILGLGWSKIILLLTWRRFSLQRAFVAPVDQLEGLKGTSRTGRLAVLESLSKHRQGLWLMFCLHIEMIFMFAFSLAIYAMVPGTEDIEFEVELLFLYEDTLGLMSTLTTLLSYGLIAPYYVTGGFLGYLNSRVELEGWDIELAFKGMAKRLMPTLSLIILLPLCFAIVDNPLQASTFSVEDVATVRLQIEELYSDEDIVVITQSWQMADQEFDEYDFDFEWIVALIEWLVDRFSGDYTWLSALFWGLIIALLGFVLWKLVGLSRIEITAKVKPTSPAIPQFVKTVVSRDIPSDLLAAAKAANVAGDTRLALAWLLYHALSFAQKQYGISLDPAMTEGECESSLKQSLTADTFHPYRELIGLWISEAWGHQKTSKESIDHLIGVFDELCQNPTEAVYL